MRPMCDRKSQKTIHNLDSLFGSPVRQASEIPFE